MRSTKALLAIPLAICLLASAGYSQTDATIEVDRASRPADLQQLMYFEGIGLERLKIRSPELKGKNFSILIKEFKNGKLTRTETAFNSKEDEYFRIKSDTLEFSVLSKMSDTSEFKLQFQFPGYSAARKFSVDPRNKDTFALKNFFGPKTQLPIDLKGTNYFLAYMMPYVRPDKSSAYCEVAQAGLDPEKLYDTYKIPHYFLAAIKFED